ncbi:MAG: decaprenylphospho-beta-D-erythro-pentofuranosid-2-ulose 2-reductase [Actinomycetota bacterium]|nr:decaprenylphospho-beta-D-erythro-pentofuranosid-2-ulose 2-reductase [Actinomycetota bacterium]
MRDALGTVQSMLVLGGSSDIGLATARRLVASRAGTVVLAGRRPEALDAAAAALRRSGAAQVETVAFDADETDGHGAFVELVFGARDFDVVVLAAGVLGDQDTAERDPEVAVEVLRTNFLGCASIALHVAQRLRAQGHGTLVVLSSVAGERVRRSNFVYGAGKAGLDGLGLALGDSLVGSGAGVLVVRPGFVYTKMTAGRPPGPLATTAEAVAEAIDDGLRRNREIVWVPGALRYVMAVLRHVPRPIFRRLPI